MASIRAGSESGLDLERSRPYRTDSCSIRARGGTPPSASLEDISRDEEMDIMSGQVSNWLSSVVTDRNVDSGQAVHNSFSLAAPSCLTYSGHFRLSIQVCAYFYFMSSLSTIMPDIFPPFFRLSGSASRYFHFIQCTIMVDMFPPLLTLRQWVFPFY